MNGPTFTGGANVALKLPERLYRQTLEFYRDTLGLSVEEKGDDLSIVDFGPIRLSLDRVPRQSQPDIWLQLETPDTGAAKRALERAGVTICDEVEPLPEGFDGIWIAAPSGTIHLVDGTAS